MPRIIICSIALMALVSAPFASAQKATTTYTQPPEVTRPTGNATTALNTPLNCFDYYHFGSVQADLQPSVSQTVPGATLTFTGKVVNDNDYPLLDGTLYVKIFKRDETTFKEGDGNPVVDQFVVADNITLTAKGSKDTSFKWKVPVNAESGEYYAAYFFTTSDRYNLMGLSFTDDVVGNQAPFTITSDTDPKLAKLSKVNTTLNGQNHHFAAFPLHFTAGDTVTVKTTIINPSDTPKTVPLQWNQYAWDAMNKDNLRFTKTEVVTVPAGGSKEVTYEIQPQRESVVYVVATTQDLEAKSILNIRYVRDGIEETRINFPAITKFPLAKDSDTTLFACAHSTNLPLVPGNTLTLTLTDKDGKTIHEYRYDGDITGAMGGYGEVFKPDQNYNQLTLTAVLERNGVIVEQVTMAYDCSIIDPNSCLPEDELNSGLFSFLKNHAMSIVLILGLFVLIGGVVVFWYKKRRNTPQDPGEQMTIPMAVFFALLLPLALFVPVDQAEAKSVQWSVTESRDLAYFWNNGQGGATGWDKGLSAPNVSVQYQAEVYNNDTNTIISDGSTIPVGTTIRIQPKAYNDCDITWFATGFSQDSPCGHWISGAAAPGFACLAGDLSGSGVSDDIGNTYNTYAPLSVNPPSKTYDTSGSTAVLTEISTGVYRIDGPGTISARVNFAATNGEFYYRYLMTGKMYSALNVGQCYGNQTSMETITSATPPPFCISIMGSSCPTAWTYTTADYSLQVPQQTITFNLTATGGNTPPAAPVISGPSSGNINTNHQFGFVATDPDNDTLRYGIDWDSNGTVDEWVPGVGYVGSGVSQSTVYSWGTTGTKIFKALAQDSKGASSGWSSYSITLTAPVTTGSACTVGPEQQINDVDGTNAGIPDMRTAAECKATNYIAPAYGGAGLYGMYSSCAGGLTAGSVSNTGACLSRVKFTPSSGVASRCQVYAFECSGPPPISADLKINNSDGPISVAKNTTVNLSWSSTNAASCSKWGGTWGTGETVGTSGSDTTVVTATTTYMVNCGGVIDTVQINVVNQPPAAPTISYVSGTLQSGQTINFSIQGIDPDNDGIYYEIDWNNNGVIDAGDGISPAAGYLPSNTLINATHSWPTSGTVTFQARTVDTAGARSSWTQHSETLSAAPPTATLEVSVNGGSYNTNDTTIDPGDTISLRWGSTNAASCTGTNFNTSNNTSGTVNPGAPAANTATTYTLACGSASDPLTVTTRQRPNFTQPNITNTLSPTFNATTGAYDWVDVTFNTQNNGGSDTKSSAAYQFQFDRGRDGYEYTTTGSLGLLTVGQTVTKTERVTGNIPFGNTRIRVTADNVNTVSETDEGDNVRTLDLTIPPPDPGLSLTADKTRLRQGETTTIRWSVANPYAGISCVTYGPSLSSSNATLPSGTRATAAIQAQSVYTLECTEATTGTKFQKTVTVETEGKIEEV